MKIEKCLNCKAEFEVSDDVVECPHCDSVMRVLSWDPLTLQLIEGSQTAKVLTQELTKEQSRLKTTNNIGFGLRLAAVLLDTVIFGVPMNLIEILVFGADSYDVRSPKYSTAFTFSLFCGFAYNVGMWAFADGATIGKKILKIKIVRNDGSPLTFGVALLRYFAFFLAALPCGLGALAVIWDKEHRGWHDKIADTKVISTESAKTYTTPLYG